jgi:hypothetical protein
MRRIFFVAFVLAQILSIGAASDCPDEAGDDFASVRKFAINLHNQVGVNATNLGQNNTLHAGMQSKMC